MSHLLPGSKVSWVFTTPMSQESHDHGATPEMITQRDVTVIGQDDDVKTTVEANLLQAVHQLTHDPVNVLDGQNQLQDTKTFRSPHR